MEGTLAGLFTDVNWLAVIVGAVVAYALGAVWYSQKMFGAIWMKGIGHAGDNKGTPMLPMIAQAGATFLFALVIGITETTDALLFAILITLTIAAFIKASGLFAGKSHAAIGVESGYVIAMGVILLFTHVVL